MGRTVQKRGHEVKPDNNYIISIKGLVRRLKLERDELNRQIGSLERQFPVLKEGTEREGLYKKEDI